MNNIRIPQLCLTLILAITSSVVAEDEIFVRGSAKAIIGTLGKMTKDSVEIKPRSGPAQKIPSDAIRRIRFTGEKGTPKLNLARSSEESGLLDRALASYTELVDGLSGAAKADTEFLISRTKCRMAVADPAKVDEAIKSMEASLAKSANSFRYYECLMWLGKVQMAKGDYAAAKSRFDALGTSPLKSYQMSARVATGKVLLAQDKPAEAQTSFDAVVDMAAASDAEISSRYEAVLGKARCEQLQSNFDAAIRSLSGIIENTKPDSDSELHAQSYLQMGDCYRDQKKPKQAVMAYLHVELIYFQNPGTLAEALFKLSEMHEQVGKPERGAEAKAKLKKLYPNNPWTRKLDAG